MLTTSGLVNRIKECIYIYRVPVVVGLTSRRGTEVRMDCNFHPTTLPVDDNYARVRNSTNTENWNPVSNDMCHALCFYGYNDNKRAFYIKNSWGEKRWAGNYNIILTGGRALLAYRFVELWGYSAYVGWGAKVMRKNLDYEAVRI